MSSPASRVLCGAPTPCRPSGRTSLPSLGRTARGLAIRSQARAARLPGSWAWSPGCPTGILGAETTGPPRFLGIPRARMPRSRTPVESRCQAIHDTSMLPSAVVKASASTISQLSGLCHAACALPVYASQRRLPQRHATLGSGWWPAFAGRDWLPAGTLRGFQSSLLVHLIPPLQALPGATQDLTISPSQATSTERA